MPRLCHRRWPRRRLRCGQLHHIEPSNAVSLPHALCPLRSPQYRASAQAHVLARCDVKSDRPDAAEQSIPSYNQFHGGLNMEQGKSKACSICLTVNRPTSQLWRTSWTSWLSSSPLTACTWLSILRSRIRSSCWCTPEMWTMWPGSGRLTTSCWPNEKMPRGSTWNAVQNGCETIGSACKTWSRVCMHEFGSLTHPPHPTVSHACIW